MHYISTIFRYLVMVTLMIIFPARHLSAQLVSVDRPTISIGLLIPDQKSISAKNGAELAIAQANEKAGRNHPQFRMIVRSMEGPWGAGADQAVRLVFEDKVCALVGSHDGRNAHLVEQAATKSEVPFLSAWSGDPSLSQAFVPWFFNCAPNYTQQADTLIAEIFHKRKTAKLLVITDQEYDSRSASTAFMRKINTSGITLTEQFGLTGSGNELPELTGRLRQSKAEGILLFTGTGNAIKIINHIRQNRLTVSFFAPAFVLNENEIPGKDYSLFENVVLLSPDHWLSSKAQSFREEFRRKYGYEPGNVAAYAYDAVQVLTKAISQSGTDRENIQAALRGISFSGVTGDFRFDSKGNRSGNICLMEIKNGQPVKIIND